MASASNPARTVGQAFQRCGIGLHSGKRSCVTVCAARAGQGRYFARTDLPGTPTVSAQVDNVSQTVLSSELASGPARVRTVEHLLAALSASGISDARLAIDGGEVPLLDGSARDWVQAIASVGVVPAPTGVTAPASEALIAPTTPVWVQDGDAFAAAMPGEWRLSYGIDFEAPAIGNQWHSWSPQRDDFAAEIAPARTFGLAHQIEQLRASGLLRGGSLENALVCGDRGWLNPPLRFANEPVRHKLLDLIGDLSLLGPLPRAHILAYKGSHALHWRLAQALRASATG